MINYLREVQLFSQTEKNHFLLTNALDVNQVSVFGLTGKLFKTVVTNNQREVKLDLSTLHPGIFILKIKQHKFKQKTFKVVVK